VFQHLARIAALPQQAPWVGTHDLPWAEVHGRFTRRPLEELSKQPGLSEDKVLRRVGAGRLGRTGRRGYYIVAW
jgi:hypothetical protein